jgi:hypothetical protein
MLKPFDQSDAKRPARRARKKSPQLSLFGVMPPRAPAPKGEPLSRCETGFQELVPLWTRGRSGPSIEALPAARFSAEALSSATTRRLSAHYANLRQRIGNALDIAAYFTLREVQEKAENETPNHVLEALDFGITVMKGRE